MVLRDDWVEERHWSDEEKQREAEWTPGSTEGGVRTQRQKKREREMWGGGER